MTASRGGKPSAKAAPCRCSAAATSPAKLWKVPAHPASTRSLESSRRAAATGSPRQRSQATRSAAGRAAASKRSLISSAAPLV